MRTQFQLRRGVVGGIGLGALLMLMLCGSALSPALASAAPPVNTSPPWISETTPHVGTINSAERGTWSSPGEPITFTYQWLRCNSVGSGCTEIEGATKVTYTPVEADAVHTLEFRVKATNASGETIATSKPTNVLTAAWRRCRKVKTEGTGVFSDPACTIEGGSKNYVKELLWVETPFRFANLGVEGNKPALSWSMSGVTFEIACGSWSGEGKLSNGAAGASASETSLLLTGCTLVKPSGCKILKTVGRANGELMTSILTGTSLEAAIAPKIGFAGSSSVMSFIMEGCAAGATLEHLWTIEGYLKGVFDNAQSAMSFEGTPSSSTATITGGHPLALYGKTKVETAAGETLTLAP